MSDILNQQPLQEAVQRALDFAQKEGATGAEVEASRGRGLNVVVRLGDIETAEYHRSKTLSLTVFFDGQRASAHTADFSTEAIARTVRRACELARYGEKDKCAKLPDQRCIQKPSWTCSYTRLGTYPLNKPLSWQNNVKQQLLPPIPAFKIPKAQALPRQKPILSTAIAMALSQDSQAAVTIFLAWWLQAMLAACSETTGMSAGETPPFYHLWKKWVDGQVRGQQGVLEPENQNDFCACTF